MLTRLNRINLLWLTIGGLVLPVQQAAAACSSYFSAGVTVGIQSTSLCFNTAQEVFDFFSEAAFASTLAANGVSYSTGDPYATDLIFNSVAISISSGSGQPAILLSVPELGINETFAGATRAASARLLEDYYKNNTADVLSKIVKFQAANSPSSPVVGQGGLMPTMIGSDFSSSFSDAVSDIGPAAALQTDSVSGSSTVAGASASNGEAGANLIGFGLQYSALNLGGQKVKTATLPLSYTVRSASDPRHQLQLSAPITLASSSGSKTYYAGLGMTWRIPITSQWTVSPGMRVSAAGSRDLVMATGMGAVSLASTYVFDLDRVDIAVGNMIGRYKSFKLKVGDYSFDPEITNTVYRNGVMLLHPVSLAGHSLSFEYSLIDTRLTGTKLYYDNAQEVGITVGTNKRAESAFSFVRMGISYLRSRDADGVQANFGYWF